LSEIVREVKQMARAIAQYLHTIERQKDDKIVFKKDKAPELITDVIYGVHAAEGCEFMPHDTTCEYIYEAACIIADSRADTFDALLDEECKIEADVNTPHLLQWAQDNPNRLCKELESCCTTIVQSLSIAQEEHKREIFDILLNELRKSAEKVAEEREECEISQTTVRAGERTAEKHFEGSTQRRLLRLLVVHKNGRTT
jgi:hypothetical protein